MRYQCCACTGIFPGSEARDGAAQGYRDGVLCPKCGANIMDDLLSMQGIIPGARAWYGAAGVTLFLALLVGFDSAIMLGPLQVKLGYVLAAA